MKERFLALKKQILEREYGFLNPEQRRAVFAPDGPLLILAGAGSGKTTVIVSRIEYLIRYGNTYHFEGVPADLTQDDLMLMARFAAAPDPELRERVTALIRHNPVLPYRILAITFTNKAAAELKSRLEQKLGSAGLDIWAATFHSACVRILRMEIEKIGFSRSFTIYDTTDSRRVIKDCISKYGLDEKMYAPRNILSIISNAKNSGTTPDEMRRQYEAVPRMKQIANLYEAYCDALKKANALDFDDIILHTVRILQDFPETRQMWMSRFEHVLVDEYQDTNYAQFVLTKLLSDGYRNIMVVGDDDQSIYRFRGATVENILNFDKTYPDATVVKLEQNYRSTENILNAANAIIRNNGNRHKKSLWSEKGAGEKILIHESTDQNDEGKFIVDSIIGGIYKEKRKYSDYAVLYRVNALGRSLQTSFTKSGIPFKVVGDMGFYDHKEVKDMIAYLSVLSSSGDNLRLKRIINEPKRKIGAATVDAIEIIASELGKSMYEVISSASEYTALGKNAEKLGAFASMLEDVRSQSNTPSEYIRNVYELSGYRAMLEAEGFEGEGKMEYVNEFVSAAVEYETRCAAANEEPTLYGFLEEISLVSDVDKYDDEANAVVLMTIHAAKGLEFPVVFLAGMEDGIFPSAQNFGMEEMSEERRLAYVAITRAKEKLVITYAKSRMMYGKTTAGGMLSCFIREEMPRELTELDRPKRIPPRIDASAYSRPTFRGERRPFGELDRKPDVTRTAQKKTGPEGFGLKKIAVGARVRHGIFGDGTVISVKDMGGDVLYGVKFDTGEEKRLMATFAKLIEI